MIENNKYALLTLIMNQLFITITFQIQLHFNQLIVIQTEYSIRKDFCKCNLS